MNIDQLDNLISFNEIFKNYENLYRIPKNSIKNEKYFINFVKYLGENYYRNYKNLFKTDYDFEKFIISNFNVLPINVFYSSAFFHTIIQKIISKNFEYLHKDKNILLKLISFYEIPEFILKIYDTLIPQYFTKENVDFFSILFKNQHVPKIIFSKYLPIFRKNKDVITSIMTSKYRSFYEKAFFSNNWNLFCEFKKVI